MRVYEIDLSDVKITSKGQLVLYAIIDHANNKTGECYPSLKTLAKETKLSLSSVQRGIKELLLAGLIKKKARFRAENGSQTSNLYILVKEITERVKTAIENADKLLKAKQEYMKNRSAALEAKKKQVKMSDISSIKTMWNNFALKFQYLNRGPGQFEQP